MMVDATDHTIHTIRITEERSKKRFVITDAIATLEKNKIPASKDNIMMQIGNVGMKCN